MIDNRSFFERIGISETQRNCAMLDSFRPKGGYKAQVDTQLKEHNDKVKLVWDIIKFMRKNWYFVWKPWSHKAMKEFLIYRL